MKITDLLKSPEISLSNEEKNFVRQHGDRVNLLSLDEHAVWLAQNLVRKGIYEISNDDNQKLVKVQNAFHIRSHLQ